MIAQRQIIRVFVIKSFENGKRQILRLG